MMYSTCLYCTRDLGANDVVETLPIGRRLAFDAAQGRLWVVCRHCAKWNLVPFETRLESIDTAERLFRETPTRYSTEHIGLAKVREGLELVRIGRSERREFAAWRYGWRGGGRHVVTPLSIGMLQLSTIGMAVSAAIVGAERAPLLIGGSFVASMVSLGGVTMLQARRVGTVRGGDGRQHPLRHLDFGWMHYVLESDGEWCLQGKVMSLEPTGLDSMTPTVPYMVRGPEAVGLMQRALGGGPMPISYNDKRREQAIALLDRVSVERAVARPDSIFPTWYTGRRPLTLWSLPEPVRLALLMATYEQREREWLEGELALLEREWRDAERLAKLADGFALDHNSPPEA